MENNNLFFNLPTEIQNNIVEMKEQIEKNEKDKKMVIKSKEEKNIIKNGMQITKMLEFLLVSTKETQFMI